MKLNKFLIFAIIACFSFVSSAALAEYPERPIRIIVPWAAGGGTDTVARLLAQGMEEHLGVPVNVVNRTGAGGIIGHTAIANAKPDGYTIGLVTAEIAGYHWMGTSPISYKDFQPIAQVNFDPAAFSVNVNSEWDSLAEAFKDIKTHPGKYTLSGVPAGAAYHLALSRALSKAGIDPNNLVVVPSQGAAPGFQELAAGGVDIVASSVPEGKSMRQAGLIKTLAVFSEERLPAYPKIPTMGEAMGITVAAGTWRGLAGPKGMPKEAVNKLAKAAHKVVKSDHFQKVMSRMGYGIKWRGPEAFGKFMAAEDAAAGKLIKKLNLSNKQ